MYLYLLRKRNMVKFGKIFQIPKWARLEPLLRGGAALQMRTIALNIAFLAVARVTQSIDETGVAAAAHAMAIQVFQVGGIVLLALSTVAQIVVPNDMVERYDAKLSKRIGGKNYAKATVNRLLAWGGILGIGLGSLQLLLLPLIQRTTPIKEVRDAAMIPAIFACGLQVLNSLVFIGEGVMVRAILFGGLGHSPLRHSLALCAFRLARGIFFIFHSLQQSLPAVSSGLFRPFPKCTV
jgi:Na+-driven multidrug efflux pump